MEKQTRVFADQQAIGGLCDRDDQWFTDAVGWLSVSVFSQLVAE